MSRNKKLLNCVTGCIIIHRSLVFILLNVKGACEEENKVDFFNADIIFPMFNPYIGAELNMFQFMFFYSFLAHFAITCYIRVTAWDACMSDQGLA